MTKAILTVDEGNNLMFDCTNHAEDHDACTIMSTLCNVLVETAYSVGKEPTTYNPGHVRIDIFEAEPETIRMFEIVYAVMHQAAAQHPEHIKMYT